MLRVARTAVLTCVCAGALTATPSDARPILGTVVWSVMGAGCVPTGQTSNAHKVFNTAGDAVFSGSLQGEIILTCPIPATTPRANRLTVTARHTIDPYVSNSQIFVQVRKKDFVTAGVSNALNLQEVGYFVFPTGAYFTEDYPLIGGCQDFSSGAYYLQVNIKRTMSPFGLDNPIFASAVLTSLGC